MIDRALKVDDLAVSVELILADAGSMPDSRLVSCPVELARLLGLALLACREEVLMQPLIPRPVCAADSEAPLYRALCDALGHPFTHIDQIRLDVRVVEIGLLARPLLARPSIMRCRCPARPCHVMSQFPGEVYQWPQHIVAHGRNIPKIIPKVKCILWSVRIYTLYVVVLR